MAEIRVTHTDVLPYCNTKLCFSLKSFDDKSTSFMRSHVHVLDGFIILLFFISDKLNSTAFAPVKMDFQGNIRVRF